MNPVSPQDVPHEFLIFQQSSVAPTKRTPWLMLVPQLLNTPDLQPDQTEASTATEIGLAAKALTRSLHPGTSTQEAMVVSPFPALQAPSLAVQGYYAEDLIWLSLMQSKAESIHPPLQPWFPYEREQSTNSCSDKSRDVPASMQALSREAVAEKAQHDPQLPWFFTLVTFPAATQSTSALRVVGISSQTTCTFLWGTWRVRQMAWNSASVRSVNWLMPMVWVFLGLALCSSILTRLRRKIALRYSSSPSLRYSFWKSFLYCSKEQALEVALSMLQSMKEAAPRSSRVTKSVLSISRFMIITYIWKHSINNAIISNYFPSIINYNYRSISKSRGVTCIA